VERNAFGLPLGVSFIGTEKTTVAQLKAGDWITPQGRPARVVQVTDNGDGTFTLLLETPTSKFSDTFAGNLQVPRKIPGIRAQPAAAPTAADPVTELAGHQIDRDWTAFAPDSGTLAIPRADMPQVKAEHRGALVNFLAARGVPHQQEEVLPSTLHPTQQEFSHAKVEQAKAHEGGDRAILVSSDNHVLDGHHQWLARLEDNDPIRVIRFAAPIRDLIPLAHEFPSAEVADGATQTADKAAEVAPAAASPATAAQKIRAAFEALPHATLGSWHPITVEHNGVTQHFLANQKKVTSTGKSLSAIHLVTIKRGRMLAGDPLSLIANYYKLDGSNNLADEGMPTAPTEGQLAKWQGAGFPLPELPAAPATLSLGKLPNSAEPITVQNGVVHIGKYAAQDFNTGADVTVPDHATPQQIKDALQQAGAIGRGNKIFGMPKDTAPDAAAAPTETPGARRSAWSKLGDAVAFAMPHSASLMRPGTDDFKAAAAKLGIPVADAKLAWNVKMNDDMPTPSKSAPEFASPYQQSAPAAPNAPNEAKSAPSAPAVTPDTAPKAEPAAETDPLDAELADAWGHLGDVLGDMSGAKLNARGQLYTAGDLLPALSKVIELLVRKGFRSFAAAMGAAGKGMRANPKLAPFANDISARQWKAAYHAIADYHDGTDSEDAVAALSAEQVLAYVHPLETTAPAAPTPPAENGTPAPTGEPTRDAAGSQAQTNHDPALVKRGQTAALDGYAMHPPSDVRKKAEREAWEAGWLDGKRQRDTLLAAKEPVTVGARTATPTLNRQHAVVWRDERAGKDYGSAEEARTALSQADAADRASDAAIGALPERARELTTQELNRLSIKAMTDAQLQRAQRELPKRAEPVAREIEARRAARAASAVAPAATQQQIHAYDPTDARPLLLIACSDRKLAGIHKAADLYQGSMFEMLRKWMPEDPRARPDVYVISAKHGLIHADKPIENYEQAMTPERRAALLAEGVDLADFAHKNFSSVFIAAPSDYREVAAAYVQQLQKAGFVAPGIEPSGTEGFIGVQRGQLGEYLRALDAQAKTNNVAHELVIPESHPAAELEAQRRLAATVANAGNPVDIDGEFKPGVYGTPEQPLRFLSGMSAPGDFTRMFANGKNVGISVLELSKVSTPKIAQQLADTEGTYLFVDSGAYTIHGRNQREAEAAEKEQREAAAPAQLDPDALFDRYEEIERELSKASAGMAMGRMFLVMPDVVTDQTASLALVEKYAEQINGFGLQAIVPLQGGPLSLTAAYEQMMRHLGLDPAGDIAPIIGIPSAVEGVSDAELTDLLRQYGDNIHGVHILGAASDERLQPRLDAILASGYDGNVSADANRLRALITENRPRNDALHHIMQSDMADGRPRPRIVRDDQRAEPGRELSELERRAQDAETVDPEALTEHDLTTQQLNRLSIKAMTDAQLLRAQQELPKRAKPIADEIARRGLQAGQRAGEVPSWFAEGSKTDPFAASDDAIYMLEADEAQDWDWRIARVPVGSIIAQDEAPEPEQLDERLKAIRDAETVSRPIYELQSDGRVTIIDGWHRLQVAKRNGQTHIEALVGKPPIAAEEPAAVDAPPPAPAAEVPAPEGEQKFYVTMLRDSRVARLAGPFDTKEQAEAMVARAREVANEVDSRSAFDAFGVSGITSTEHRPGTLNERLGIGAASQAAPSFETYADAMDWVSARAKQLNMPLQKYHATDEYKSVYPTLQEIYKAEKAGTDAALLAKMKEAGLAIGDKVQTFVPSAFLGGATYTGTIVQRGGAPHVKIDGQMTVSSNGRLRETSSMKWDGRWKKAEAAAEVPAPATPPQAPFKVGDQVHFASGIYSNQNGNHANGTVESISDNGRLVVRAESGAGFAVMPNDYGTLAAGKPPGRQTAPQVEAPKARQPNGSDSKKAAELFKKPGTAAKQYPAGTISALVSKAVPFGKLYSDSDYRKQLAKIRAGLTDLGISKTTTDGIIDAAKAIAARKANGRMDFLRPVEVVDAMRSYGLIEEARPVPEVAPAAPADSPVHLEGSPAYAALEARGKINDAKVDALSDDQVRAMYAAMELAGNKQSVEAMRATIKAEHPDDVEAGLQALADQDLVREHFGTPGQTTKAEQAVPAAPQPALAAEHIEAGHTEPATPTVITASLKKAADHTIMNNEEARADLIQKINAAILTAGADTTTNAEDTELHAAARALEDAREAVNKASSPSQRDAARAKVRAAEQRAMAARKAAHFITFDVPGDGKFTVANNKDNLTRFRDQVMATEGFKGRPRPQKSTIRLGTSPETAIHDMLEQGEQVAAHALAQQIGKPFRFTQNDKDGTPNLYTDVRDVTDLPHGVRAYVGRRHGAKKNPWLVIEHQSGLAIGNGGATSAAAAINVARSKLDTASKDTLANAIHKMAATAPDEAALETAWLAAAEQSDQAFADQADISARRAADKRRALDEQEAAERAARADTPVGKLEAAGFTVRGTNDTLKSGNPLIIHSPGSNTGTELYWYDRAKDTYRVAASGGARSAPGIPFDAAIAWLKNWYADEAKTKAPAKPAAPAPAPAAEPKPLERTLVGRTAAILLHDIQDKEALDTRADADALRQRGMGLVDLIHGSSLPRNIGDMLVRDIDHLWDQRAVNHRKPSISEAGRAKALRDTLQQIIDTAEQAAPQAAPQAAEPPAIPDGFKPMREKHYRAGVLTQGYAPHDVGDRVKNTKTGHTGVIEGMIGSGPLIHVAMVKYDNGTTQSAPMASLEAEQGTTTPAASEPQPMTGPQRAPFKVNFANPYEDGNIVKLDGKPWQVRSGMNGWYLTDTGNYRGTHPVVRDVKSMSDLIGMVEQQAAATPAAAPAKPTAAQNTARFDALRAKLRDHGLSEPEAAEMRRLDPAYPSPEDVAAKAKDTGVPAAFLASRPGFWDGERQVWTESDAELQAYYARDQAEAEQRRAYGDYQRADSARRAIEDAVYNDPAFAAYRGMSKQDMAPFHHEVARRLLADAARVDAERNTEGSFEQLLVAKRADERWADTARAMNKAALDEARDASSELDQLSTEGYVTPEQHAALKAAMNEASDPLELADLLHDAATKAYQLKDATEAIKAQPAANDAREPWQLTRDDYAKAQAGAYISKRGGNVPAKAADDVYSHAYGQHERLVNEAITRGDDVPEEVRAEYQQDEAPAAATTEAADTLTPAQAQQHMTWRDLGQRDGVTTHRLMFSEDGQDGSGSITIANVQKIGNGKWQVGDDGERYDGLRDAKKAATSAGIDYLRREGYVAKEDAATIPSNSAELEGTTPEQEPWELTRAAYLDAVRAGRDFPQLGVKPTPLATLRGAKDFDRLDAQAASHHEAAVTMAAAEGKPVPDAVLEDYPSLKPVVAARSKQEPTATTDPIAIVRTIAKAQPFAKYEDVRDAALAAVQEQTGKRWNEHDQSRGSMLRDPLAEAIHDGQYSGMHDYAASLPVHISESAIPLGAAVRAFAGTSHSPEARGASVRRSYFRDVMALWQRFERAYHAAPADRQADFVAEFNSAAAHYAALTNSYLAAHSRVMSSMITGPARFPVESNRKKGESADRRAEEANEYLDKAAKRLTRVLRGAVDQSLASELKNAQAKLAGREQTQELYKATNAALRKDDDAQLAALGYQPDQIAALKKPDFAGRTGIPAYQLQNNNAEIRRLRDRVEEITRRIADAEAHADDADAQAAISAAKENGDAVEATGPRLVRNAALNRLQVFFDGKPAAEIRAQLKSAGFKWAPSTGAWQRQLTDNAVRAAQEILDGLVPTVATAAEPTPPPVAVDERIRFAPTDTGRAAIEGTVEQIDTMQAGNLRITLRQDDGNTRQVYSHEGTITNLSTAEDASDSEPLMGNLRAGFTKQERGHDAAQYIWRDGTTQISVGFAHVDDEITNDMEVVRGDDDARPRGKGIATALFLTGLDEFAARFPEASFRSESTLSDDSTRLYERLQQAGVPFARDGNAFVLSNSDLHMLDFARIKDALAANAGTLMGNLRAAPGYYSELARQIGSAKQATMPADQWASWLSANAAKLGIKKDELDWSGILDYLALRAKDKLTRDDLAAYLDQNGVRVQEVEKGTPPVNYEAMTDAQLRTEYERITGDEPFDDQGRAEIIAALREVDAYGAQEGNDGATKYGRYTLPGGAHYRELLLTLPMDGPATVQGLSDAQLRTLVERNDDDADTDGASRADLLAMIDAMELDSDDIAKATGKHTANYQSGHWAEPNIVAHIRMNDRVDADGHRVLFIEEMQSDWAQQGKKLGFDASGVNHQAELEAAGSAARAALEANDLLGFDSLGQAMAAVRSHGDWQDRWEVDTADQRDAINRFRDLSERHTQRASQGLVPAPFVTSTEGWLQLAIKRVITYAAAHGYDKVAFVNGQQSAERYDLSKSVNAIEWDIAAAAKDTTRVRIELTAQGAQTLYVDNATGEVLRGSGPLGDVAGKSLDDVIGKELAEKIMAQPTGELSGDGLKVGGDGMKAFYDQIVPQNVNAVLKKLGGGKVEAVGIAQPKGRPTEYANFDAWMAAPDTATLDQPGFTLTDTLRTKATAGLPLFNQAATSTASATDQTLYHAIDSGASATDLLHQIAATSATPFQRALAEQLLANQVNPTVGTGNAADYTFATGMPAQGHGAGYAPTSNHVVLFEANGAATNLLHEFVHAATASALRKGGKAAMQMKALYADAKRSGQLASHYGMRNLDEFVAEAHANPAFQHALQQVQSGPRSLWDRFVDIVRAVLGMGKAQHDLLSQVLAVGRDLMAENNGSSSTDASLHGNLTQIATHAFKRWFGDWQQAAQATRLTQGAPVATLQGDEISANRSNEHAALQAMRKQARAWGQAQLVGGYTNQATGQAIEVRAHGIKETLQHGGGIDKIRALAALPALLEHGVLVADATNVKNAAQRMLAFAAKVRIAGNDFIVTAGVREDANGRLFYDHELMDLMPVADADRLSSQSGPEGQTTDPNGNPAPAAPPLNDRTPRAAPQAGPAQGADAAGYSTNSTGPQGGNSAPGPIRNTLPTAPTLNDMTRQFLLQANAAGLSKVVNPDGTPRVVYHGTMHDVSAFRDDKGRTRTPLQHMLHRLGFTPTAGDFFFAANPEFAGVYAGQHGALNGGNVLPVYLHISNPARYDAAAPHGQSLAEAMRSARQAGHDGMLVRNWREQLTREDGSYGPIDSDVYIAFDAGQIKSATGNNGNFDPANPSLLGVNSSRAAQRGPEVNMAPMETNTQAFKDWFGASTVVDPATGAPLPVYHGGRDAITQFEYKGNGGTHPYFYFAESKEWIKRFHKQEHYVGMIAPGDEAKTARDIKYTTAYLALAHPLDLSHKAYRNPAGWKQFFADHGVTLPARVIKQFDLTPWFQDIAAWHLFRYDQGDFQTALVDAGYDGLKMKEPRGGSHSQITYAVFRPDQIKIVNGKPGGGGGGVAQEAVTRPPGEPGASDLMGNLRQDLGTVLSNAYNNAKQVELAAGYQVGDFLDRTGKVSWWHKTIGTMDNLARRHPAFNAVYRAVQSFLGEVSRVAVAAAERAPRLLPQLEHLRDIAGANRKQAVSAADTKAIAAPIFEGTLLWARDESGRPVKVSELEADAATMRAADKAAALLLRGAIDQAEFDTWMQAAPVYAETINRLYEHNVLQPGVVWSDAELRALFQLDPGQIGLYREFRAAIAQSVGNLTISEMLKMGGKDARGALTQQATAAPDLASAALLLRHHYEALAQQDPALAAQHLATAQQIGNLADKGQALIDRGYAPLMRFGKYTVYVTENQQQVYFGMFEDSEDAAKMARKMQADHQHATVRQGTVSEEKYKLFAGISPETVELFGTMLGLGADANASDAAYQDYLRLTKANRSALKRMIHRKGTAGFSEDPGRVLASFIYSNARLTASNLHSGQIDEAVEAIPQQQGQLADEAVKLRQHIRDPQSGGTFLSGLMFAQFLGGSVASAMVNATQPIAITLPYLSQYGGVKKAFARIKQATIDAAKKDIADPDLAQALKDAAAVVAPQEIHFLQAQGAGKGTLLAGDGTRVGDARAAAHNTLAKVKLGWGKLFALAELANRKITFIAAYRTAREEGLPNPTAFATEAVNRTQFVYNAGNKPRWARNPVGGLLLTFKQYSVNWLELLSQMAFAGRPGSPERKAGQRAVLYMLAVLFMLGGADGLPFEQDLEDAIDGVLQRLGYNFSSRRKKQEFLAGVLGDGGADFITHGLSALPGMPVDFAGRMGMGNLVPGSGLWTKKENYTRDLGELAGPAGDFAKRAFTASGKALGGNLAGAAHDLAPLAVRNVVQGIDMARTGTYRDARGYIVNHTTPLEAGMKAIGFQPNSTAAIQDAKGQALNMISQARMRSQEIAEHWAQGRANHDEAMVAEARDMRDDWNEKNPDTKVNISMPGIIRRAKAMREDALARTQKTAGKALKQAVKRELSEVRD
jgi:hypothetical protein